MNCPQGHPNPEDNKYCQKCGLLIQPAGAVIGGKFVIQSSIGVGGFGATYLVTEAGDTMHRRYVLKQLLPERLEQKEALELFQKESRVLGELQHPGIPRLVEVILEDGQYFLVMEYVFGASLGRRLASGESFSEERVRDIFLQLIHILKYLHDRPHPIYHRDIKPDNLLLKENGKITLIDFGGVALSEYSGQIQDSTRIFTQGYTAPEQRERGISSVKSDLYSAAASMVHLLTGKHPQEFLDPESPRWTELCNVKKDFADLLNRMLSVSESVRFQSADEVLEAFERLDPIEVPTQIEKIRARTWGLIESLIIFLCLLATLVSVGYWIYHIFKYI